MSDPFRPITTSRRLNAPANYRMWTTTRQFPAEYVPPVVGANMQAILGTGNDDDGIPWASHRVFYVTKPEIKGGLVTLSITHGPIPGLSTGGGFITFTEYESFAYRFPPIYPNETAFFPGGSQGRGRTVPARVVYEYAAKGDARFNAWLAAATIWNYTDPTTGPFEVESRIAFWASEDYPTGDGGYSTVGRWLSPSFIAQDTINNSIGISIPGELTATVEASRPSATTYAGWVNTGTEIMASRSLFKFQGDVYGRRTVWIKAQ
jgi:hypothetical protein